MEDLFKKFLYTGVGLVSTTADRARKAIDDLVETGKLSKDEGKKVVDDLYKDFDTKKEEFETRFRNMVDKAIDKMNLAKAEDLHRLEKRIKSLEVKLGLLNKEVDNMQDATDEAPKATKKTKE